MMTGAVGFAADPAPPWQHGWPGPWWHDAFWPLGAFLAVAAAVVVLLFVLHHLGHTRNGHHRRELSPAQARPGRSLWNPSTPKGPPGILSSDHEREAAVRLLSDAIADGRMSLQEGEERIHSAYAARYREDLIDLVKDLPRQ